MSKCYAVRTPSPRPGDAHLFVCVNRRPATNPLGPGCGDQGEEVHTALRQTLARRGLATRLWLARSSCLGLCPRLGTAVALAPGGDLRTEVSPADAGTLIDLALSPRRP